MKAKFFIPFFILLATGCHQTQQNDAGLNGDQITLSEQAPLLSSTIHIPLSKDLDTKEDKSLITNLELLGRLWGFLKYHHPEVGKGSYDWDDELFQMLPQYIEVKSTVERDEFLLHWIEKYGEIPECATCTETPADAFLKPDFTWVERSDMGALLKVKIKEIYQKRHQGEHYYIELNPYAGNPVFRNENPYSQEKNPDTGLRLLALYRYWNMIQYFYPSKYLTDKDWNDVLKEYIPKFVMAETALQYQLAVLQLTVEINDTHAYVREYKQIDSLRGSMRAPFRLTYIENRWVVTDNIVPNIYSPLKPGDIITHINGKKIESIVDSIKAFYPASNEAAKMRILASGLLRSREKTIDIDYISSNHTAHRERLWLVNGDIYAMSPSLTSTSDSVCYKTLEIGQNEFIGYITLKTIKDGDINKMMPLFMESRGIIIDIRDYPNLFVPFALGAFFISEDRPFVKFTQGNVNNPGEFTFRSDYVIRKAKEPYKGKLVVIVNERTLSQGEYTAMAFRAGDNTTIIGSQTAGADGNISIIYFPGGLGTYISGSGVYYPDGRETQRIGIVPDVEVKPTIQGIREGRDELLERAIEIIRESK